VDPFMIKLMIVVAFLHTTHSYMSLNVVVEYYSIFLRFTNIKFNIATRVCFLLQLNYSHSFSL